MVRNFKVEQLLDGKYIISKEPGNSMAPKLKSREPVILEPVTSFESFEKGDIAYVKIKGKHYTHLVYGTSPEKGLLIGNNKGYVQGWTKKVYGKAHLIPAEWQDNPEKYLEIWLTQNNIKNGE